MSFHNFSSRPQTKSSFSSLHSTPNSKPANFPKLTSSSNRVMSNLKRSNELLSVEGELRELLKNSNLNLKQKKAFSDMLETTFDLFQVPLNDGSHQQSLIDSSSIELYSKMQSLVTSLTSLIMNEEESTRLETTRQEISQLHNSAREEEDEDSTEFSDGEISPYKPNGEPVLVQYQKQHQQQYSFPRSSTISSFRQVSRNPSIDTTARSRQSFTQRSPSITQTGSPSFRNINPPTFSNANLNIRQSNNYEGIRPNNTFKPSFQVMQTPVPRSFSSRTQRPQSMFVSKKDLNQFNSLASGPMKASRSVHNLDDILNPGDDFNQEFGSDHLNNSQYYNDLVIESSRYSSRRRSSREGSIKDSANKSKRYSMRF